jgi:peptide/nickel transport system substrate-binding protein
MDKRKINRRDFLKVSAIAFAGTVATACGVAPAATPSAVATEAPATAVVAKGSKEPPLLQPRVDSGELPPLDERLPETPAVVGDRDAIGVYGGEVRMIHFDPVWAVSAYDWNSERLLHYSDQDLRTIVPNVFESWEVSPDGTTFTITMRKGMKWSDGEPLTTEDVRFFIEDAWFNTDLYASPMWQLRFDGGANTSPATLEVIDDFTFKLTYAAPFGALPAHLTRWEAVGNWPSILGPSHFYKQFHNKYTDQAKLDEMAVANQLETWVQLYQQRSGPTQWGVGVWQFPSWLKETPFPTLAPWILADIPQEGLIIMERNPYYWRVDVEGNQLPYLDTLRLDYITTGDAAKLKLAQNELDSLGMHDVTMAEYAFYKENETAGNFQVMDYISAMSDREVLFPQHVIRKEDGTPDDVMTEIAQHPNFVKALSVAIDREEINQSLLFGTARMGQLAPLPSSKYYKEEYGTAWAQFDTALANQLLDEMGLDKKNAQGIRLRSDGQPLTYVIEQAGLRVGPLTPKVCELVAAYWRDIGIDATSKEVTENLLSERMNNGQVHCTVWHADRCTDLLMPQDMQWFIPLPAAGQGGASSLWANWWAAADKTVEGLVEPPDQIKKYYDLYAQMTSTADEDERVKFGQEIFDGLAETPLGIGLILEVPAPLVFNKNMRNLPKPKSVMGWDTYGNSTYHPEAFFYEGGTRA